MVSVTYPDRGCNLLPEIEGGHREGKTGRLIRGFGGLQSGLRRNSFRSKHLAQGAGDAGSLPQLYVTPGVRFTLVHPTPRNTGRANRNSATRPPDKRQTLLGLARCKFSEQAASQLRRCCCCCFCFFFVCVLGSVRIAARWPKLRDTAWFPALGDGTCSSVGCGCAVPQRAALMIGTTGALRAVRAAGDSHVPTGLWCYRMDHAWEQIGGVLGDGGNLFEWMNGALNMGLD